MASILKLSLGIVCGIATMLPVSAQTDEKTDAKVAPAFQGRMGRERDKLLRLGGGKDESEAMMARGLAWLARQQRADGFWVFDGTAEQDFCASTSLSLLPYLAVGQTHIPHKGNTYQFVVAKGVDYLLSLQNMTDGTFRTASGMISHCWATTALCELYGLTGDGKVLAAAKLAINHIVKSQKANGSWRDVVLGRVDSMSIEGWAVQALHAAVLCQEIPIPTQTLQNAFEFMKRSNDAKITAAGTKATGPPATVASAICLTNSSYVNGWTSSEPTFQKGIESLVKGNPPAGGKFDMDYNYHATRAVFLGDGDYWKRDWNPLMRDLLVKRQVSYDKGPATAGSWDKDIGVIGEQCGRLGTTCMAILTLEVYYRYPRPAQTSEKVSPMSK